MINYPLTRANRIRLAQTFFNARRVDLSIDCVLEDQMGQAWVDCLEDPTVFQIQTGPFVYFAGDLHSAAAREMIAGLPPFTLVMPTLPGWLELVQEIHGERFELYERASFSGESITAERLKELIASSPWQDNLRPMEADFIRPIWGQDHFIDLAMFDSIEDFEARGIGFYVRIHGDLAGAVFSQLVCSQGIEVSLFVLPEYRRQGVATLLSASLIKACLNRGQKAHWDAANPESGRLAVKLGYLPAGTYEGGYLGE
jgi:GNAT superfamily N-acetyltransferase